MKKLRLYKFICILMFVLSFPLFLAGCKDSDALTPTTPHEHQWSEWNVTKEPTYTEDGEEQRYCLYDNETETRSIPKLTAAPSDPNREKAEELPTSLGIYDGRE
jgi:hypothetical protein